jgi:hypothetical protein
MNLTLNDLTPGTVAITVRGDIAVVTEQKPRNSKNSVIYKIKTTGSTYKGAPDFFTAVVGSVNLPDFLSACEPKTSRSNNTDADWAVPEALRGLKIGDKIIIRNGLKTEEAEYLGFNPRRPKNGLSIGINGKQFKGSVGLFIRKAESTSV